MNQLTQRCPFCNGPVVMSAGRAICVAGPGHCAQGYEAMRQLTTDARKVQADRSRRRRFAGRRRWISK